MTVPDRPRFQKQGPASNCVIGGKYLGWFSCTAYSTAMAIDRHTLGRKHPSGCDVRWVTGDTSGGLTLPQCAGAARNEWDVYLEVRVGSNVCSPAYAAKQARLGRGFVLQGNTRPLLSTRHKSTGGAVNHAIFVNQVRGGTTYAPAEALVYDPAADGRYSWVDKAPSWWSWALVKKFAAALMPYGDTDPYHRTLGSGKFYAAFTRDTEPHNHPKFGSIRTVPFPDRMRIDVPSPRRANVRSRPDRLGSQYIIGHLSDGALWVAYQRTRGIKPPGSDSDWWYGNHDGTKWIHASSLSHIGGAS